MQNDTSATNELIARARQGDVEALGQLLEACRPDLHDLAERQLHRRLTNRVDASDIIQQTFLEAHRRFTQFRGQQEAEWVGWLRGILEHKVLVAIRDHMLLQKRDVRRERSLDDSRGGEAALKQQLAAGNSTPSQRAIRLEEACRLTRALATLPEDQRNAVRLRHLEGWALDEIAQQLGRTPTATAGLIKRGMRALRQQLRKSD
jgi:RNA polymerase sigma-70 factor (ECF subfamily)